MNESQPQFVSAQTHRYTDGVTPTQDTNSISAIRGLPVLFVIFTVAINLIYLAVIPPWAGPDEPKHYEYVHLLNDKGRLVSWEDVDPVLDAAIIRSLDQVNYWKFGVSIWKRSHSDELPPDFTAIWGEGSHELHQPPLAYLFYLAPFKLVAAQPIFTQLNVLRLLSILLNVVVVLAAYMTGKELFDKDPTLALAIPIFVMLLPQHLFLHATVNNDHLAEAAMAWMFPIIARCFRRGLSLPRILALLLLLAIGLGAKRSGVLGIPILGSAFLVYAFVNWGRGRLSARQKSMRWAGATMVLGMSAILFVGVWNWVVSNLPSLHDYIVRIFLFLPSEDYPFTPDTRMVSMESLPLYASYLKLMFISTWGHFGWLNIQLGVQVYWFFAALMLLALAGLVAFALREFSKLETSQRATLVVFAMSILFALLLIIGQQVRYWDLRWGGDPQGRYLFPVLIPLATFLLIGVRAFVPKRFYGVWLGVVVATMVLYNIIALVVYIIPFYAV